MKAASPIKLKRSGEWGAKLKGAAREGDEILITTKNGKSWSAFIEKVIWSGNGVSIVATRKSKYTWKEREQMGNRYAGTKYDGMYCGYPCPVTGKKCSPENGPCHDCE